MVRLSLRTAALVVVALLAALLCLMIMFGPAGSADAAVGLHRLGTAPRLPQHARALGQLPARTRVSVDVTLAVHNPAGLQQYAQSVATPGSPDYHHYLTVAQLRRRFAPTAAQLASVRSALKQAGLTPSRVSSNGLLIHVTAPASRLSAAFHTRLERVRLADGHLSYENAQAPAISASIAGLVQAVVGLDNLTAAHPLGLVHEKGIGHAHASAERISRAASSVGAPVPCAQASSLAATKRAYTADEIASAYGFNPLYGDGDLGAGQTVAVIEFEEYASSDIAAYQSCYQTDSHVSNTLVDGGVDPRTYTGGAYGSGEAALDIEQIIGLAPAASVDVYEAPDDSESDVLDVYTAALDNSSVDVVSTSWGECEFVQDQNEPDASEEENTIFEEMAAAGKSMYAAAGDTGSTDCDGNSQTNGSSLGVDDPGSQPYVTSVGGTTLPAANDTGGQTVWNDSSLKNGATGGGVSIDWTMPGYQSGASSSLGVINPSSSTSSCGQTGTTYCREVPDVSADADPQTGYTIYYDHAWQAIAGTSAAAPLWAALTAIANASTYCSSAGVGFVNPALYGVAGADYSSAFSDVTSGNNDYTPSLYTGGSYPALPGYDSATGLGTPNAAALIPDMCTAADGSSSSTGPAAYTGPGSRYWNPSAYGSGTTTASPPTTTTASPPTVTTPAPVEPVSPPTAVSVGSTGTPVTSPVLRSPADCRVTTLWAATDTLGLSRHRRTAKLSIALRLPSGCGGYFLSLQRHITTTEHRGAIDLDTLTVQLLSHSGKVLATVSRLSNANAAAGYRTVKLNLDRYAGQRLTLRFTATRRGTATTVFTLRSVALKLS